MMRMLYLAYIVSMTYFLTSCQPEVQEAIGLTDLTSFKWENRIVVVFSSKEEKIDIVTQLQSADQDEEIVDRDILWFVVSGDVVNSNYFGDLSEGLGPHLRDLYQIDSEDEVEVVLIGKDGGVKYRDSQLLTENIYTRIDAMPMRQSEMRLNGSEGGGQ
ncbi:MAG: DUF4174 domain-containing protein [Chloroflexota bacterium]